MRTPVALMGEVDRGVCRLPALVGAFAVVLLGSFRLTLGLVRFFIFVGRGMRRFHHDAYSTSR